MNDTLKRAIGFYAFALSAACLAAGAQAQGKSSLVTLTAKTHGYHNTPVEVALPGNPGKWNSLRGAYLMLTPEAGQGGQALRGQIAIEGRTAQLAVIMDDLAAGQSRTYRMGAVVFVRRPDNQVEVKAKGDDVEISFDNKPFTTYATKLAPNKPIFYPILTPDGSHMTRRWPVEPDADKNESHDHPHHRGLWFTHSMVNGVDFWSEQDKKVGKTVTTGFEHVTSGWVFGGFTAKTEWRTAEDKLIATDRRDVKVFQLPNGDRVLDFSVTLTPVGGPLTFGDNKDGVFGLRVPDSLAITADRSSKIKGEGHIETASGMNDKAAWGKPNDWVDYWGPVGGQTYGVAIFDAPSNLRHPETWHARDYALFTVNPFGLHDFGRGDKGAGDYTVPEGKSINFTYRVLFHKGDTKSAGIAEQYAAFADPPEVSVK